MPEPEAGGAGGPGLTQWSQPVIDAGPPGTPPGAGPAKRRRRKGRLVLVLLAVALLVGGAAVVGAGVTGRGPLRTLGSASRSAGGDSGPTTPGPPAIMAKSFTAGECVVWDEGASVQSDSQVVPCSQEHFIEITGSVDLAGLPEEYPSPAGWTSIIGERCQQLADSAYGAKLDPEGRFTPGGLKPVEAGWQQGQRQLWCGIQANWVDQPLESGTSVVDQPTPFTGAAKGQPQYWVYKSGDCLGGVSKNPVPCTQPHEIEVVGEITLADRPTVPPVDDTKGWTGLAGSACDKQVRAYLGGKAPKAPWEGSYVAITPESWAAGKRNVTCIVGSSMTGGWATVSVSAKTAAR